jgi:hypothetical protein
MTDEKERVLNYFNFRLIEGVFSEMSGGGGGNFRTAGRKKTATKAHTKKERGGPRYK